MSDHGITLGHDGPDTRPAFVPPAPDTRAEHHPAPDTRAMADSQLFAALDESPAFAKAPEVSAAIHGHHNLRARTASRVPTRDERRLATHYRRTYEAAQTAAQAAAAAEHQAGLLAQLTALEDQL